MTVVHLATGAGLLQLDDTGATCGVEFEGREVVAVDARGDVVAAAVSGGGVWLRAHGDWRNLGMTDTTIWTVALGDDDEVYAGVEPAALWCLANGSPRDLGGLAAVDDHDNWHSPWGPADLSTIVVDGDRLVVGVEVGGIAVSHDRGETWEARNEGLYEDVHSVVADGSSLYATTGMGCFVSRDEGRHWTWASDGIDRGYTLGLAQSNDVLVVGAASGPPPLWDAGGPEAAIFRADAGAPSLEWARVFDDFAGAVERNCLAASGDLVVAGTTAGELLLSHDGGRSFALERSDLAPVHAVAISD
jgi:BNR/Asp-box repeat.